MNDIDFLPEEYHQQHAYRHAKPWQIIVISSFLGLVALATISQNVHRRFVEKELAELAPAFEMALGQKQLLTDVQKQLKQTETEAELITYLHHPWPKCQLLAALLSRLPQEITLQQLQITRESANTLAASDRRITVLSANSTEQQKALPPAQHDLQSLRNQFDGKQTVVILIGATTDSAALHRFLDEILSNTLFSRAELGSVTNAGDFSGGATEFHAKLFVKPGYGAEYASQ